MCMDEKMSIIFLPCAHQVLCEDCIILHQKKGMDDALLVGHQLRSGLVFALLILNS